MLKEKELVFAQRVLERPPLQSIENASSDIHETYRVPDPYIFIVTGGKVRTPNGELVEDCMDRTSYLGRAEDRAFQQIQSWADKKESGTAVWFSPPFGHTYPVSKLVISEISEERGEKILFNRAIVLDVDGANLLDMANELSDQKIESTEALRSHPVFPDGQKLAIWLDGLRDTTHQVELIKSGYDLTRKTDTYTRMEDIQQTYHIVGPNSYHAIMHRAKEQEMIGKSSGSCPKMFTQTRTPFEAFSESYFNCPKCEGKIPSGKGITTCPHCGITKEEVGSTCD